jgi:hypothetical protein
MSDSKNNKKVIGKPKPTKSVFLSQVIEREIKDVLSHFENEKKGVILEHLILLFKDLETYSHSQDEASYNRFAEREMELIKKHGRSMEPYRTHYFYKLFNSEILMEKGYYTSEEYNALGNEEKELTELEIKQICQAINRFLNGELQYSYLDKTTDGLSSAEAAGGIKGHEAKDEEMTEARQLLAVYFLLKAGFGIESRHTHDISKVARMAHLLLRRKITSIQNSSIYEKLKTMPYYKKDEHLIEDLKYIRPFFKELDVQKALELIDQELEAAIQGLPAAKRKNYRAE